MSTETKLLVPEGFSYRPPLESVCGCGRKCIGPCPACDRQDQREQRDSRDSRR